MYRNSFFFCAVFAFLFSACDPGSGPGGIGDVRDDIAGVYDTEVVDSEYTCPPEQYMPAAYGMTVRVISANEEDTLFDVFFNFTATAAWPAGYHLNTYDVPFSSSGDFDTSYPLTLLDGTSSDVTMTGAARHGELTATYAMVVHAPGSDCLISATIRGERDDE